MRYLIILGFLTLVAVSPAAPPVTLQLNKPGDIATLPPLGNPNHNVIHDAGESQPFADIVLLPDRGNQLDVEPREREFKKLVYLLHPECKLNGVAPALSDLVLKKLTSTNVSPLDRRQYFAWFNRENLAVIGWRGYVEAFTNTPEGLLIKLRVTPLLRQRNVMAPVTLDAFTEYYLLDKHQMLNYVRGHAHQRSYKHSLIQF